MDSVLVVDFGSRSSRCSFSWNKTPKILETNPGCSPTTLKSLLELESLYFVGEDASRKNQDVLPFKSENKCMTHGRVTNYGLLKTCFENFELGDVSGSKVVCTENPMTPIGNRVKTMEMFFEDFSVGSLYIGLKPQFAALLKGITTGLVVDIQNEVTFVTPLDNSRINLSASIMSFFGDFAITNFFELLLSKRGYKFDYNDHRTLSKLKEYACYLFNKLSSTDYVSEVDCWNLGRNGDVFQLPDRRKITLGHEMFTAPELLYRDFLGCYDWFGKQGRYGITSLIEESISRVDENLRPKLYENIVLSGETTSMKYFGERLSMELDDIHIRDENRNIQVHKNEDGSLMYWKGARWFAEYYCQEETEEKRMMVSRMEYNENGGYNMSLRKFDHYLESSENTIEHEDLEERILFIRSTIKDLKISFFEQTQFCVPKTMMLL